jgi:hypothetical protein
MVKPALGAGLVKFIIGAPLEGLSWTGLSGESDPAAGTSCLNRAELVQNVSFFEVASCEVNGGVRRVSIWTAATFH